MYLDAIKIYIRETEPEKLEQLYYFFSHSSQDPIEIRLDQSSFTSSGNKSVFFKNKPDRMNPILELTQSNYLEEGCNIEYA